MSSTVTLTDGTTTVTFTPGMEFDYSIVKELNVKAIPNGRVINRDLNKRIKTWSCSGTIDVNEAEKASELADFKHTQNTLTFTHPGWSIFSGGVECRIAEFSATQPQGEGHEVSYLCRMVER